MKIMKGFELAAGSPSFSGGQITEELFMFSEVIAESSTDHSLSVLWPVIDMVWNSFGCECSLNYSEEGKWQE